MPVDALIITAPIRIGICINADTLVNNPMVIKKPHNKCIHVTTKATQSGKKLKLLPARNALNDTISLIKEMPFEVRAIPRAARSNNNNRGCVVLHLSSWCKIVIIKYFKGASKFLYKLHHNYAGIQIYFLTIVATSCILQQNLRQ